MKQPESEPRQNQRLDEQVLAYLNRNRSANVGQVYDALLTRTPSLTRAEFTGLVWRLVGRGEVGVEDILPATRSFLQYLGFWESNLSLHLSLAACLATLLVVYVVPSSFPLVVLRWVLGSLFVFFIPGYVTVEALFPKARELDAIERLALSLGLSVALVPLMGLVLNYTPWGVRLDSIMMSLTILVIGLVMVSLVRRFRLSVERFESLQLS